MQKAKKLTSVTVLAAALLAPQVLLRAYQSNQDQTPSAQTQQIPDSTPKETKVTGIVLNQANVGSDNTSTTLSETYLDFGSNKSLWIVGGEAYDQSLLSNSGDFGFKY